MGRNIAFIAVLIVLIILGAILYFVQRSNPPTTEPPVEESSAEDVPPPETSTPITQGITTTTTSTTNNQTPTTSNSSNSNTILIKITASGFSPSQQKVKKGDKVTFVNNDTQEHWPASDVHPTHRDCPGFDAQRGLQADEQYTFEYTFDRDCYYHDHLKPRLKGELELE